MAKRHRDAQTGEFITEKRAKRRPARTVAETVRLRGGEPIFAHVERIQDDGEVLITLCGEQSVVVPRYHLPKALAAGADIEITIKGGRVRKNVAEDVGS